MISLRPYQLRASDSVIDQWREVNSTLGVLYTGGGKTIIFSDISRRRVADGGRVMILAHRQELIWQARNKMMKVAPHLNIEVEMGEHKANEAGLFKRADVVISTVQTHTAGGDGMGRMGKFDPADFDTVIIDEAHHRPSPSYTRICDYYSANPKTRFLGVTATPDRADEEAMGQFFDTVAFEHDILDGIKDGWLVPIDQQMVHVGDIDLSKVRTTAGDLNGADLAKIMEGEKALHGIVGPSIDIIGDKRSLIFTASVEHARQISNILNRHRSGIAAWVCGATNKDDRTKILADFECGKIQVVVNCAVLTEGYDNPAVEVVLMAKPTKSRALYAQMIGRGTRTLPGVVDGPTTPMGRRHAILKSAKPKLLVVDFVGNSGRHKLMTSFDILGGNVSEEAIETAINHARRDGRPMRADKSLSEIEQQIKEREEREAQEKARKARLLADVKFSIQSVDPFNLLDVKPVKERGWDKDKQLSEAQRNMLRRNKIDPDKINYAQGKQLLFALTDRIKKNLCSFGQMKMLKKHGIDPKDITFAHAHAIIDAIVQNGWRKPDVLPAAPAKVGPKAPPPKPQSSFNQFNKSWRYFPI